MLIFSYLEHMVLKIELGLEKNLLELKKGEEVYSDIWVGERDEVKTLMPKILDLIKKAGGEFKDIKKILVYRGPGGFSATRIAVTTANTLGLSLGCEVWGYGADLVEEKSDGVINVVYSSEAKVSERKKKF